MDPGAVWTRLGYLTSRIHLTRDDFPMRWIARSLPLTLKDEEDEDKAPRERGVPCFLAWCKN